MNHVRNVSVVPGTNSWTDGVGVIRMFSCGLTTHRELQSTRSNEGEGNARVCIVLVGKPQNKLLLRRNRV